MTDPVIRIAGATGGYGELTILHGIDVAIPKNSWTTIIGANGAGKSTLLKLIAGRIPCRTGAVVFEGRDLTRQDALARLRQGIGFVPQGRCNFPMLSVAENLKLGAITRRLSAGDLAAELDAITTKSPRSACRRRRWAWCSTPSGS